MDFANEFLERIQRMSKDHTEVRLLFDEYIENSLKNITRERRNVTKKDPIHYHVNDFTLISNPRQFLGHWKTKYELSKYLGEKVCTIFFVYF